MTEEKKKVELTPIEKARAVAKAKGPVAPEWRTRYKVFGLSRVSNVLLHICDAKSVRTAEKMLLMFDPVIRANYSAVEIVRCRRVRYERVV